MRPSPFEIAELIIATLPNSPSPIIVAIDGRGGVGKSTAAAAVDELLEAKHGTGSVTLIEGDTFYGGGSATTWERRSLDENVDRAFDWRRQREVLRRLEEGRHASWPSFDWHSPDWDSDDPPFADQPEHASPAPVILVEGVYTARPENADLVEVRVLIEVPEDLRHHQLAEREGMAMKHDWEARWARAEEHYFRHTMPRDRFDLVIDS